MKIAFVDIVYGYGADRPDLDAPLGGTTSALCFLARELKKNGVEVALFNTIGTPHEAHGIPAYPVAALREAMKDPSYTDFIFPGRWLPPMVEAVRQNTNAKLTAWMHESQFEGKLVTPLPAFDNIVFVSDWQARVNEAASLPHWRRTVIRNAMNPRYATLYAPGEPILSAKDKPPLIVYAGDFVRGAFHIPPILLKLREIDPNFTMEIYCETELQSDPQNAAAYFDWLRQQPNVAHIGKVPQPRLAERMKKASILLSPNPWPETSCIVLLEALAAGLIGLTTDRGALTETGSGFATHIPVENRDEPLRFDTPIPHDLFAMALAGFLKELRERPEAVEERQSRQRAHFLANYRWPSRAEAWQNFLS